MGNLARSPSFVNRRQEKKQVKTAELLNRLTTTGPGWWDVFEEIARQCDDGKCKSIDVAGRRRSEAIVYLWKILGDLRRTERERMKTLKEIRWAEIVHSILLLKNFTPSHLKDITCSRGSYTQGKEAKEVTEVISQLVADGSLVKQGELYRLTSNCDKRFDLSRKVEKIERKR